MVQIRAGADEKCRMLCATVKTLQDNSDQNTTVYEDGFPLCIKGSDNKAKESNAPNFINNHVNIKLLFHTNSASYVGRRIASFEVEANLQMSKTYSIYYYNYQINK